MPAFLLLCSLSATAQEKLGTASRPIRLGMMLPLNNATNDGQHMIEYYRGVLMACDSLRKLGVSVEVRAWDVAEYSVLSKILGQPETSRLDLIIGPFYSNKVQPLADFAASHDIMLVLPYAVEASQLATNRHLFQVCQSQAMLNERTVERVCNWFKDCHPVIIDCADSESTRGAFTSALRKEFEKRGMKYNLTSLASPASSFQKAFDKKKRNLVILNSSRQTSLASAFEKLNALKEKKSGLNISMLGYEEWQAYANVYPSYFHQYDLYLPSTYYTNMEQAGASRLAQKYQWNFHEKMLPFVPRYALTGFDHAVFFLRGLYKYGKSFDGAEGRFGYAPVQTPLKFVRVGRGGYQNQGFLFVHYTTDRRIETINY